MKTSCTPNRKPIVFKSVRKIQANCQNSMLCLCHHVEQVNMKTSKQVASQHAPEYQHVGAYACSIMIMNCVCVCI